MASKTLLPCAVIACFLFLGCTGTSNPIATPLPSPMQTATPLHSPTQTPQLLTPAPSPGASPSPFSGTGSVPTDNYANRNLGYYYFVPPSVLRNKTASHPALVCVPGLSQAGKSCVSDEMRRFAEEEGFVIIAPSFIYDESNWNSKTSYQFPAAWSGNAFLQIVDRVKSDNNISISKLYLFGFSAGAQFVLRFALWRPDLVRACAAHASGGTITPTSYNDVVFLVTVGSSDEGDRIYRAQLFRDAAQQQGINVTYREYPTGHALTPAQITDSLALFRTAKGTG